ncbi:hypothetical protein [Paraburkholderia sp. GAS333]|uniref:non-homologous end-joining DNA ligase LigD n=1 Tax=Paraburkholderia sp. GAS333 TaxID=3156279 RepID=UPI003D197473
MRHLAKAIFERFSAKSGVANRIGKVFVDYLRNAEAQSTATAFLARAPRAWGCQRRNRGTNCPTSEAAHNGSCKRPGNT